MSGFAVGSGGVQVRKYMYPAFFMAFTLFPCVRLTKGKGRVQTYWSPDIDFYLTAWVAEHMEVTLPHDNACGEPRGENIAHMETQRNKAT